MKKISKLFGLLVFGAATVGATVSCRTIGFRVGLLCLHGQTSTYDNNFIDAFESVCKEFVAEGKMDADAYEIRTDVAEDYSKIYTAAKEWAEDGYSMIFADSFGHQYGLIDVAKEYPNTEFYHGTGTIATEAVPNLHTAFASIYEGRYLAGYAAGLKMGRETPKDQKINIGYVGAWPYAEVISGYTSYFLGFRKGFKEYGHSIDDVTMYVQYTNSWYDYGAEKHAASNLIIGGDEAHGDYKCKLISQHADSMGSPQTCAANAIPNVCYNISTKEKTPNTYVSGCKINWKPYFKLAIQAAIDKRDGKTTIVDPDWTGDLKNKSVELLDFGNDSVLNPDDKAKVENLKSEMEKKTGEQNAQDIFNCEDFTVSPTYNESAFYGIPSKSKPDEWEVKPRINVIADKVSNKINDFPAGYKKNDDPEKNPKNVNLTTYWADAIDAGDYQPDTNVIKTINGDKKYFAESSFRSAPYFDLIIDGIIPLN